MEKIKLIAVGTVISATLAFVSPASAFSLGAAMSDISKSTLVAALGTPLASIETPVRSAATARHCATFACPAETVKNSIRFAVYRAGPDAEIFTGSIPAEYKSALSGELYPAFNIGFGTQTIWPSLSRVDLPISSAFQASRNAPEFLDI